MSDIGGGGTPLYYWDACVMLADINNEPQRATAVQACLKDAEDKLFRIITSVVSMVEVAFDDSERTENHLDPATLAKIDSVWSPASPIEPVEFHEVIAREARDLTRAAMANGWRLTPIDAIHLATAKRFEVAAFHTYDEALKKYEPIVGFPIEEPVAARPKLV